jgi:hypothetical protein
VKALLDEMPGSLSTKIVNIEAAVQAALLAEKK